NPGGHHNKKSDGHHNSSSIRHCSLLPSNCCNSEFIHARVTVRGQPLRYHYPCAFFLPFFCSRRLPARRSKLPHKTILRLNKSALKSKLSLSTCSRSGPTLAMRRVNINTGLSES